MGFSILKGNLKFPWGVVSPSCCCRRQMATPFSQRSCKCPRRALFCSRQDSVDSARVHPGCRQSESCPRSCLRPTGAGAWSITQALPWPLRLWDGGGVQLLEWLQSFRAAPGGKEGKTDVLTLQRADPDPGVQRRHGIWAGVYEVTWSCHLKQTLLRPNLG